MKHVSKERREKAAARAAKAAEKAGHQATFSDPKDAAPEETDMSAPQLDDQVVQRSEFEKLKSKVKKTLNENLVSGETIRVIIHGAFGQAIIGTDRRIFVCKPGFMAGASFGAEVTSWSYINILGIQRHKGLMSGAVVVQAPGQPGTKTSYWGNKNDDPAKAPNAIPVAGDWSKVDDGIARLRQLIDGAHARTTASREGAPAALSTADELRKLADLHHQGILTDEEFQAAKTRLLSN